MCGKLNLTLLPIEVGSLLGLILSFLPYLRSALGGWPLSCRVYKRIFDILLTLPKCREISRVLSDSLRFKILIYWTVSNFLYPWLEVSSDELEISSDELEVSSSELEVSSYELEVWWVVSLMSWKFAELEQGGSHERDEWTEILVFFIGWSRWCMKNPAYGSKCLGSKVTLFMS